MWRKDITILSILSLFVFIGIIFFYFHKNINYEITNPIIAVPSNAGIIIKISQPNKIRARLKNEQSFVSELEKFETFRHIKNINNFIDTSLVIKQHPFPDFLNREVILSLHPNQKNRTDWFLNLPLLNRKEEKQVINIFKKTGEEYKLENISNSTVFLIAKSPHFPVTAFASINDGIVSISNSQLLIENSMLQRKENSTLLNDSSFLSVHKTVLPSNIVSITINFSHFENLTGKLLNSSIVNSGFVKNIAKWCELDLEIRDDAVSLNGFSVSGDNDFFVSLFSGVAPQKSELVNVIPAETKFLMTYTFNNKGRFRENLLNLANSGNDGEKFFQASELFKKQTGRDFDEIFFSFIEKEFGLIYTEPDKNFPKGNRFLIFNTSGQARSLECMAEIMQQNMDVLESNKQWVQLDEQTRFPVYNSHSISVLKLLLKNIFPEVPADYFTFFRNYIVFANSSEELHSFMYSTVLNKSLSSHPYFSSFAENFSYHENFFLFSEIPYIFPYAKESLNPEIFNPQAEQIQTLSKFYGAGLQFSSSGNLVYTSAYLNYTPTRDQEPRTIWQSRLDSTITGKPALVENHISGDKEILVQDKKNNLYLINNVGRVLWKRTLDGPIISEIVQIDFYNNKKLQYLFNTNNRLYLLDRNGNHVAKYPFTLSSPATNGLSVVDYDNKKDYRIFIALSDNKVHLFDKNGNSIIGWNSPLTEGTVKTPVQYFNINGRDYIVFSDQYRNYILDRRGENRIITNPSFVRNSNSLFYLEKDGNDSYLVTSNQSGLVAKILIPTGECSLKKLFDCPQEHGFVIVKGLQDDALYLFITEDRLVGFNKNEEAEFDVKFEQPVLPHADIYQFSPADIKYGIVEKSGDKIHLIGNNGKNYQGFPLKGNSRFSIGFMKTTAHRFNLIVGGDNNLLNNYSIE